MLSVLFRLFNPKYREAELKHGRIAMLASLGILTQEKFNPLFDGRITGPAIFHFQQADNLFPKFWLVVGAVIAWIEGANIVKGWEPKLDMTTSNGKSGIAELKPDYVNGANDDKLFIRYIFSSLSMSLLSMSASSK